MSEVSLIDGHVDDSVIKDKCPFCEKPIKRSFLDSDGFCNCGEKFYAQSKKWRNRKNIEAQKANT